MQKPATSLPTKRVKDDDDKSGTLNFADRIISFFNPEAGLRRAFMREKLIEFGYNDTPGQRGKAPPLRGSESWDKNRDRYKMMADARDLCTHDWIGGIIARVVLYVCGRVHCKSELGDDEIGAIYDEYFYQWCGDETSEDGSTICDITGRHRLSKMIQMAFAAFLVDGDHGLIEIDPAWSPTSRFCLQSIEADRIGSPLDSTTEENYIGGIIKDENGRVLGFKVYERTRAGQYVNPNVIPVESFIHVADLDRPDEYRGRSKLLRILNDARDIREWILAEKIAGKTQSQWAAMIGTKDPTAKTGPGAWDGKNDKGTPTQDAIWGKILKMSEGENFAMLSPSARPSGAFMEFVQMIIRKMAASLNLPYGFLWDLATLGGVTARIEIQGALRQIQYWQENVLVNKILNRIRHKVIAEGIALGAIPAHPNWKKCTWYFGAWVTTDAGYEMDNDIAGATTGIVAVADITAKYGKNPSEVFESNAATANAALGVGAKFELPVEVFAKGLFPDITNQKAAITTPPPPPPKPGTIEAVGEKVFAEMAKLIQAVKKGDADHDSVVQTFIRVLKIPKKDAEEMVPANATKADMQIRNPKPAPAAGGKVVKPAKKKK